MSLYCSFPIRQRSSTMPSTIGGSHNHLFSIPENESATMLWQQVSNHKQAITPSASLLVLECGSDTVLFHCVASPLHWDPSAVCILYWHLAPHHW